MKEQKRSSENEMDTDRTGTQHQAQGVGGRQPATDTPSEGGGYLDICTTDNPWFGPPRDPRLDELRRLGLSRRWIQIAETIGFDAFMSVWQILDEDNHGRGPSERENVRIQVPLFAKYLRFQRNRYILALDQTGMPPHEIKRKVRDVLREDVSIGHINRIVREGKL